ncbi:MAG: hypothetical protein ACK5MT_07250 [Actinomycetales bacterium]
MRPFPRRILWHSSLLAALLLVVGATSAQAHRPDDDPSRTGYTHVEPWTPGVVPDLPPAITVFASCVRQVDRGTTEAVFGYESTAAKSILLELGELNAVQVLGPRRHHSATDATLGEADDSQATTSDPASGDTSATGAAATVQGESTDRARHWRGRWTPVEAVQSQPTLILPQRREAYVFAVRYPTGMGASWEIASRPQQALDSSPDWRVTATTSRAPRCGPQVPEHFSVVQVPDHYSITKANEVWSIGTPIAHLAGYDVRMGPFGPALEQIACSPGGVPTPSTVWFAWPTSGANLQPLDDPDAPHVVIGGLPYLMSTGDTARVADVSQPLRLFGPNVDVFGHCAFDDGTTATSLPFWADQPTRWDFQPVFEDPTDPTAVTGVVTMSASPGGVRIR